MRDILFRGKAACGAWVQGDLIHRKIWKSEFEVIRVDDSGFDNYQEYEVATDTIGQYTGLTDKNGKKIWEGDIVEASFKSNRSRHKFKVVFLDGMFLFDNSCVEVSFWEVYNIKVIGNIHDNKEMLEVK